MTDKLVLSIPEAASRLGIGRNTAYEAVRRGEIPTIRIGKRILVPISALDKLLDCPDRQTAGEASDSD